MEVHQGAIAEIFQLFQKDKSQVAAKYPTVNLQLIKFKSVTDGDKPKLRFTFSDGKHIIQGVQSPDDKSNTPLTTQDPGVQSIIKLKNFEPFLMSQTRPVVLVWDWEVIAGPTDKIGSPTPLSHISSLDEGAPAAPAAAAAAAAPKKTESAPLAAAPPNKGGKKKHTLPADVKKKAGNGNLIQIEQLSPYSNAWVLRVRVSAKSDLRTYRNARGEGKLFNVTFIDESGEIRATGFNQAVDNLYDKFEEGKTYFLAKCGVNMAKKQFSNVKNDFELMFERDTVVSECLDSDVPQIQYNFVELGSLTQQEDKSIADVIGVMKDVGESQELVSKAGNPYTKRDVQLVDQSNVAVSVAFWGKSASEFKGAPGSVLTLKGCKVSDFGGRSLSVANDTAISIDPDIPEAHTLRGWYDQEGQSKEFTSMRSEMPGNGGMNGPLMNIEQVKAKNLGMSDSADYFRTFANVVFIRKSPLMYPACATDKQCMKKAIEETDGRWRCEKCDETFDKPNWRYMITANVADHSGEMWVSFFNDTGEQIIGQKAEQVRYMIDEEDEEGLGKVLSGATGNEYQLKIQARMDTYNDQTRVRYACQALQPVNFIARATELLDHMETAY